MQFIPFNVGMCLEIEGLHNLFLAKAFRVFHDYMDLSLFFIVFFQNVDASLYKDVSTFLSLYKNVSTFFEPGHFIVFFQNVDASLYKDVSIFSALYRNVFTFLSQGILLFSFKMWIHLYTRMFSHFYSYIGMYPHF